MCGCANEYLPNEYAVSNPYLGDEGEYSDYDEEYEDDMDVEDLDLEQG